MENKINNKLQTLKSEFESGKQRLAQLDDQANALSNSLVRVAGAIQVLEELLAEQNAITEDQEKAETNLELAQSEISNNGK